MMTPIDVDVAAPIVRHRVTLRQITEWLNRSAGSPNEVVLKDKLRSLLPDGGEVH
jgi:hypothetical protein